MKHLLYIIPLSLVLLLGYTSTAHAEAPISGKAKTLTECGSEELIIRLIKEQYNEKLYMEGTAIIQFVTEQYSKGPMYFYANIKEKTYTIVMNMPEKDSPDNRSDFYCMLASGTLDLTPKQEL